MPAEHVSKRRKLERFVEFFCRAWTKALEGKVGRDHGVGL